MSVANVRAAGKILVIRGGAIGDFILTLPVLAALRSQFPQARLEVMGYRHIAELAVAGGLADDVRHIEARALAGFFARRGELLPELREYFAGFAVIVSYLYDPDTIFAENVALCSKAQFIVGLHRPDNFGNVHATEVFLKPLERLAIFDADPVPRLQVGQASSLSGKPVTSIESSSEERLASRQQAVLHVSEISDRLEGCPTLAVHPGSGSERKNWPEPQWAELLRTIIDSSNAKLLLVGGEAEGERLHRLARGLPSERIELARSLPLPELARRLTGSAAFIGHDSGITHLAAAVGLPGLVLWGDTARAVWSPRSGRMRILESPKGLAELAVETVADELKAFRATGQG